MATNTVTVASGLLASRVFEFIDQQRFAEFSGDFNLVHMDALAARRTQAGKVLVHGMHQLLWALEQLRQALPEETHVAALRARFPRFLFLNEEISLSVVPQEETLRLSITTNEVVVADIAVTLAPGRRPASNKLPPSRPHGENAEPPTCHELTFDDMDGRQGKVRSWSTMEDAERYFPCAAQLIGGERVNAIAALSRLVGMICPGLHSMFSGVDIRLVESGEDDAIHFSVAAHDRRFSHVRQRVSGSGIEGKIEVFLRQPPATQKNIAEVARLVAADEFAGTVALVVGASRGLGEMVAKLIAAGGGHVLATYSVGRRECEELAGEIRAFGGRCDVLAYDARRQAAEQLQALPATPTSLYYFATTKIFQRGGQVYEAARLREFLQVYVDGFYDLCCFLQPREGKQVSVVYPSSVYVESRPADMTAYAMAKAAGEILCQDMNRVLPGMRILMPRLPRLATDQTSSISLVDRDTPDVSEILLPIVRQAEREGLHP